MPNIEDPILKPFFCRAGNKYVLRKLIIPLIPKHYVYVEPFFGSGAIFFNKKKAPINIINDLDKTTINNIKLLMKAPSDLTKYKQDLNNLDDIKLFYNMIPKNNADKLTLEKIKTSCGFFNKVIKSDKDIYKSHNPFNVIKNIDLYKKKLNGVHIYNKDYRKIIKEFDSLESFFFLDPPYENTNKGFGYAEDKDTFNFNELLKTLKNIKGQFLMTINDSPYIRELFKDFYIKPFIAYSNNRVINNRRNELFISNYII